MSGCRATFFSFLFSWSSLVGAWLVPIFSWLGLFLLSALLHRPLFSFSLCHVPSFAEAWLVFFFFLFFFLFSL